MCEECTYRIQRNILHPLLIAVLEHGATETLEMLVRMVIHDKASQRLALYVFFGLDFDGHYARVYLNQEVNLLGGVVII